KWINIDEFDKPAASFLKKNFHIHPLDVKDCFETNQHPKVDSYPDYLFIILNFPEYDPKTKKVVTNELDVFIGKDYLVTVQKKRFKALKNCFYKCAKVEKTRESYFGNSSVYLLYKIVDELFRASSSVINNVSLEIDKIENQLFEQKISKTMFIELSQVRRNILNFKSIIDPQRFTINNLVHSKSNFFPKESSIYFDDIHDWIEQVWVRLNNYLDILDNLNDMNQSIISNKTNEVIKVLTVISVGLLPLTLLSGIYGMNIEGLPWIHTPAVVASMFGILLGVIIVTLLILKKKNWL
ncbi:MAG: magnesium transporter CorA family protein, partial [Patescibacteria group bacterium]